MSRTPPPDGRLYVILLVDDTPGNLAVAIAQLEDRGFQIAVAQDGEEALKGAALVQPDLILLDVLMPGMNGFETCRRLKASESTRDIPVIFMTVLTDAADKVTGFEAGGIDYVTKPFDIEEVVARVETHLAMHALQKEVEANNAKLLREIAMREQVEAALRLARDELEQRVADRTAKLAKANTLLQEEIAERERAEEERELLLASEQAARFKAETADRLKDEFLATLSHELRTPLTAIVGWARLLRAGTLDAATMQRGCEVIERNSWAELQIVEDLLDVSAIIGGKLALKAQPVDLALPIEAALDCVKLAAEAKGVRISLALNPMTRKIWGELGRLQQVVWNLLSNAIKFTPAGGHVTVSLQEVGAMARIRVSDTGEGVNAEFLPHMFDRFRQADSSTKRQHGGLGLGLSIVRHLVEMHGGTVRSESAGQGQGATLTVDLPLMPAVEDAADPPSTGAKEGRAGLSLPTLTGLRVLVIDDEPDIRELMTSMLAAAGTEVRVAGEAQGGFALFEQWRPDVLVSDIGLPGEDGYALIRRIRALPVDRGGQTPAAALTAYADQNTREKTLAEGYQMHVPKPVDPAEFIDVIAMLVSRGRDGLGCS